MKMTKSMFMCLMFSIWLGGVVIGGYLVYKIHPDIIHIDNEVTGDKFDLSDFSDKLGWQKTKNYFMFEVEPGKQKEITLNDLQKMYFRKRWKLISIRNIDSKIQYIFRR